MQANALTCEPASQMLSLLNGCLTTQAIHVAARLGIADELRDGTRRIGDLWWRSTPNRMRSIG